MATAVFALRAEHTNKAARYYELSEEKSMNIKIDGIEQITVSTQTTGQKQDVIIEKEKYEDEDSNLIK